MRSKAPSLMAALLLAGVANLSEAQPRSIDTPLCARKCKLVTQDRETGATVRRCPGIGGYKLLLEDDDERMSITVVSPGGEKHPLELWSVVTRGFSKVGKKAEWRVFSNKKHKPTALILRIDARIQEDAHEPKKISYFVVAKISDDEVCIVRKFDSAGISIGEIRKVADNSGGESCLKP